MIQHFKKVVLPFLTFIMTGCFNHQYKVDDFTPDALMWYKPYNKTDTVIYISEKNELDTITFYVSVAESDSIRSFEQGFYNTNYLSVPYEFSKGSYHQFAIMGDGKTRYDQNFLNMYRSSAGFGSFEICFIGTIFSDNLKNIQKVNDSIYFFNSDKADYSGMNVENGIRNFTFNNNVGVTEYLDDRNVKWKRKYLK